MAVSHGPSADGFAAIFHQTCLHADPKRYTPQRQADGEAQLKKAKKPNVSRRVLATARCHRHGDEQGGQQSKEPNQRKSTRPWCPVGGRIDENDGCPAHEGHDQADEHA